MFIQDTDSKLVFIKSEYIKVFPCGRRRSTPIDMDNNPNTVSDQRHIPFDPEARLNTEANNRKHSGLNGYKQSYLNYWHSKGELSLVLAGYLFDIETPYVEEQAVHEFGSAIATLLGAEASHIYANIKLADIAFFQGSDDESVAAVSTKILRDQSTNIEPATCLDFLIPGAESRTKASSYYFSGLSFSDTDLSESDTDFISMQLLDKTDEGWAIHNASRLPVIEHGDAEDSTIIPGDVEITGNLTAESINTKSIMIGDTPETANPVASLKVVLLENNKYQLNFFT